MRHYESVCIRIAIMHFFGFSKKILTLGLKDEVQPHPKALQLQRMVRYAATLFIQVRRKKTRSRT